METPKRTPRSDYDPLASPEGVEAEADIDQRARSGVQPAMTGSLVLEDIGYEQAEDEVQHQKKGKFGVLFYLSLAWLLIVVFCAVFATWLPLPDPNQYDMTKANAGTFTDGRILGGDGLGRDILSRLVHGARVSMTISVAAVLAGTIVGGGIGLAAGYIRGRFEGLVMGGVNTVLAFPGLILLLTLVAFVGQNLSAVTFAVAVLSVPTYTRVSRATTLAVAQREYVTAAQALGAKRNRILIREIAPNVMLPVAAFGLLALGTYIILEASLAFLGLSVQPPDPTWGSMINEGRNKIGAGVYHLTLTPALVLFFTVFSLNYVGDAMRNRYDVREAQL